MSIIFYLALIFSVRARLLSLTTKFISINPLSLRERTGERAEERVGEV